MATPALSGWAALSSVQTQPDCVLSRATSDQPSSQSRPGQPLRCVLHYFTHWSLKFSGLLTRELTYCPPSPPECRFQTGKRWHLSRAPLLLAPGRAPGRSRPHGSPQGMLRHPKMSSSGKLLPERAVGASRDMGARTLLLEPCSIFVCLFIYLFILRQGQRVSVVLDWQTPFPDGTSLGCWQEPPAPCHTGLSIGPLELPHMVAAGLSLSR